MSPQNATAALRPAPEERRCKLCNARLDAENPRGFCRRHSGDQLVKYVCDDVVVAPTCDYRQAYTWICEKLGVDEESPKRHFEYREETKPIARARWAAVWVFREDFKLKPIEIEKFLRLKKMVLRQLFVATTDMLAKDEAFWSTVVEVRKRYRPQK